MTWTWWRKKSSFRAKRANESAASQSRRNRWTTPLWLERLEDRLAPAGLPPTVTSVLDPAVGTLQQAAGNPLDWYRADGNLLDSGSAGVSLTQNGGITFLGGTWASSGYSPIVVGSYTSGSAGLGSVSQSGLGVMSEVTSFSGESASYRGTSSSVGSLIARWSVGLPLAVERLGFNGRIIELNFFPVSNKFFSGGWFASTHSGLLMRKALQDTASPPPSGAGGSILPDDGLSQPFTLSGNKHKSSTLVYTILSNPIHGTLCGTAPSLTFTPTTGYVGNGNLTFKVNNGLADSNTATVSISTAAGPTVTSVTPPSLGFRPAETNT